MVLDKLLFGLEGANDHFIAYEFWLQITMKSIRLSQMLTWVNCKALLFTFIPHALTYMLTRAVYLSTHQGISLRGRTSLLC